MELQISDLENSINNQVRQSMEKAQKNISCVKKSELSTMSWVTKEIQRKKQKSYVLN